MIIIILHTNQFKRCIGSFGTYDFSTVQHVTLQEHDLKKITCLVHVFLQTFLQVFQQNIPLKITIIKKLSYCF